MITASKGKNIQLYLLKLSLLKSSLKSANFLGTLNSLFLEIFFKFLNSSFMVLISNFLIFLDTANLWGIDYDKTLNDNSSFRSAIGIGVDWLTPVGPLNFSFAQPITKSSTDVTETFRFNLGTTF